MGYLVHGEVGDKGMARGVGVVPADGHVGAQNSMVVHPPAVCAMAFTTWCSGWMGIRICGRVSCRWRDRGN